jgi:N-acetylneuraminic acid mutarotase
MRKLLVMTSRGLFLGLTLGCLCSLSACLIEPPRDPGPDAGTSSDAGTASSVTDGLAAFTATLLPEGEVLVVGGQKNKVSLNSAHLYNPETGAWRDTGSLMEGRDGHTSLLLLSGKVLVMGGTAMDPKTGFTSPLSSVELYDPVSGRWSPLAPMPQKRGCHQVTRLLDGRILVTGGYNDTTMLATVDEYDPATGQWSARATMSLPRCQHTATLLPDGRVLVAGGHHYAARLSSAEVYDPATDTWSDTDDLSGYRLYATAHSRHDGKVLVMGGETSVSGNELYDPTRGTWTVVPFLTGGVFLDSFPTRTLLPDGRVIFAGGYNTRGPTSTVRFYHSETYEWSSGSPLPEPRVGHEAILLPTGKVLLVGGKRTDHDPATPVVTYDPRTDTWE